MPTLIGLVPRARAAPPNGAAIPGPPPPPTVTIAMTSCAAARLPHSPSRPMWLQRTIETTTAFDSFALRIATSVPNAAAMWPNAYFPSTRALPEVSAMTSGRAFGSSVPSLIDFT
jgi:hypothetical protein